MADSESKSRRPQEFCANCAQALIEILDQRIKRILEVSREEAAGCETDGDIGQSHCFHLMEIQRILRGQKTCGIYDDFGSEVTR